MEENKYLKTFYADGREYDRLKAGPGRVEYAVTMHYIHKYAPSILSRVLEVGAANGAYSHALARAGYSVDAVELLDNHIAAFQACTKPGEDVTIHKGDARDLNRFADNTYDLTLVLGPLYHLYNHDDKLQALREAVRVTKPGGIIFAAYVMNDATLMETAFKTGCAYDLVERGVLDPETFMLSSDASAVFALCRTEDIEELRSHLNVTPLCMVNVDGASRLMREAFYDMPEETFQLYVDYRIKVAERRDMMGFASHVLDIFQVPL